LAQAIEAEQRLQHSFLSGIFRPMIVPKRTTTHGQEKWLMAHEKRGEGGSIANTRSPD